jgi:hypothetical protein
MNGCAGKILVPLLIGAAFAGCSNTPSGPASVTETSARRSELAGRVRFIENYVTFRRKYEKLEYDVMYQNNGGGMVPGPSEWDVRLIAVVPPADVDGWIPKDVQKDDGLAPQWLRDMPGSIKKDEVTQWYRKAGIEVGIDRAHSIVAYRNTSTPN